MKELTLLDVIAWFASCPSENGFNQHAKRSASKKRPIPALGSISVYEIIAAEEQGSLVAKSNR